MQALGVAEGVISSNGDKKIDAEKIQVFKDFRGDVIYLAGVLFTEVQGNDILGKMTGPGSGGVKKGPPGSARPVNDILVQDLHLGTVVRVFIGNDIDESAPAAADTQDPVAFPQGTISDGADGRVEAGNVPPPVRIPRVPLKFAIVFS